MSLRLFKALLVLLLTLGLCLSVSPGLARWGKADIGYVSVDRACRDGALVVGQSELESASDVTVALGAREYINTSVALDDPFSGSPRPASDYGPDIVGGLAGSLAVMLQPLVLSAEVEPGHTLDHRRYGVATLTWNAPLAPGTRIALVYKRAFDNIEVVSTDAIIEDCQIASGARLPILAASLPGTAVAPGGALSYELAGWPKNGLPYLGNIPLLMGNRFSSAHLLTHPLSLGGPRQPVGDTLILDVFSTALASAARSGESKTMTASNPSLSGNGRLVAFESLDSSFVAGDSNSAHDIFVFDRQTATIELLSRGFAGAVANDSSLNPSISFDGRFVVFESNASNLVANDGNGFKDVFLIDRQTGTLALLSRAVAGADTDAASFSPALSADGRYVAFVSSASNLVANDSNGQDDIFVLDRQSATISLVSAASPAQAANAASFSPVLSGDGRYVAFGSSASNLVSNDSNGQDDIFVLDRQNASIQLVSGGLAGLGANASSAAPALSGDGRYIAFESYATNLVANDTNAYSDVFVFDQAQGTLRRLSLRNNIQGDGDSSAAAVSGDGRYVVFQTNATNLLGNDTNNATDLIRYALADGSSMRISRGFDGSASNAAMLAPTLSYDGSMIGFESYASNLLPTPTTTEGNIYLLQRAQVTFWVGAQQIFLPLVKR